MNMDDYRGLAPREKVFAALLIELIHEIKMLRREAEFDECDPS